MNYVTINDRTVYHPGYYIDQYLYESDIKRSAFAKELGISLSELDAITTGNKFISAELIFKLAEVTGTTFTYWVNLQDAFMSAQNEYVKNQFESLKESMRKRREENVQKRISQPSSDNLSDKISKLVADANKMNNG
jgi:addiction module HigA family antidote